MTVSLSSGAGQQSALSQPTVLWLAPIWLGILGIHVFTKLFFLSLRGFRCFLSHGNSVEINLFVLFMWLNTFLVLHLLCFCFAMKHCITYRYGYLTGRCLLCTDVKKMTLIFTSGVNSHCFLHTPFCGISSYELPHRWPNWRFFRAYGTKYRSCHFCIEDAYFWSFLFFACVNKAAC